MKYQVSSIVYRVIAILIIALYFIPYTLYPVYAHTFGQPPFFQINGVYANLYHVPLTSLSDFDLPQDSAPDNYLINQQINFDLDINRLPAPPEVVKKTNFNWDFGDGAKNTGLSTTHSYSKMGSYILKVYADDGTTPTPQMIESVLLNILPDKNYQLPKAVVKVNGEASSDPLTDILKIKFGDNFSFDATESKDPNSQIVSYLWDFGDRQSSNNPLTYHSYAKDLNQVFPVLRIKDANNFIADDYLEIQNATLDIANPLSKPVASAKPKPAAPSQLPYTIAGIILVIFILLAGSRILRHKRI